MQTFEIIGVNNKLGTSLLKGTSLYKNLLNIQDSSMRSIGQRSLRKIRYSFSVHFPSTMLLNTLKH